MPLSFFMLFDLTVILMYGAALERATYAGRPADFLFMFIFGVAGMAVLSLIFGPLLKLAFIPMSGKAIVMMLVYVWSKEFPEQVWRGSSCHLFSCSEAWLLAVWSSGSDHLSPLFQSKKPLNVVVALNIAPPALPRSLRACA